MCMCVSAASLPPCPASEFPSALIEYCSFLVSDSFPGAPTAIASGFSKDVGKLPLFGTAHDEMKIRLLNCLN